MENQNNNQNGVTIDGLARMIQKGFSSVDHRLDKIDYRLDKVDQRLDGIDQRLDKVEIRLDGIDQRLDKVDQRLDKMDYRLGAIENLLIKNHRIRIEKIEDDLKELKSLLVIG